jgi:hypothetical protein
MSFRLELKNGDSDMKKMLIFSFAIFLITTASVFAADPEELLPSPYFVDDVHCAGNHVREVTEGWLLSKDEVEASQKVETQDTCENLFKAFGIEKYMWLSPEDLERTATIIKQSGYFEEADLSIKKSEIKNHVHIFLKVKPIPKYMKSVSNDLKFYSGSGQNSSRIDDKIAGELSNRAYAPNTVNSFGFSFDGTRAGSPISADPNSFLPDDLSKLQQQNYYLADIYWKNQGAFTKHLSYDLGIHLTSDDAYTNAQSKINVVVDSDFLFNKQVNVLRGNTYFGPAFILASFSPYDSSFQTNSTAVFYPGFKLGYLYGRNFANNLNFTMSYYHATSDRSIFEFDLNGQYQLSFVDLFLIAGLYNRDVQDAVLPQDRFPISGAVRSDDYIGLSKLLTSGETKQQLGVVVGGESFGYDQSSSSYTSNDGYVGLKYKLLGSDWTVNLSGGYYFQRLY